MAATSNQNLNTEIERVFSLQREYASEVKQTSAKERIVKLRKMKKLLFAKSKELYKAGYADYKKGEAEIDLAEIFPVISEINHACKHLKKWMAPKKIKAPVTMQGTKAELRYEPKGVTLIISPWNYPINLTLGPLVSAIAAGNTAIIKPSEMTPNMSAFMKDFLSELFEEKEVAVFEGEVEVSTELLKKPFDHIFFTGSPMVGKIVMKAASAHLSSVTLELGGKSPVIVDEKADIATSAKRIAWGKLTNNGQTCIAPDYILVHKGKREELLGELKSAIGKFLGEDPKITPDYCRIVNERHFERIKGLLDEAVEKGANIAYGGEVDQEDNFIAPTLLIDPSLDSKIMHEEIFGPIIPIISFDNLKEALAIVNSRPKPLALYVFSKENKCIEEILAKTSAGGSVINDTVIHYGHANLPFGGVNNSGIGSSHGHFGFKAFSHERAVLRQSFKVSMVQFFYPPYTPKVKKLIKNTIKYFA